MTNMKNLIKKVLCIALTSAISVSALSGCGAGNKAEETGKESGQKASVQVDSNIDTNKDTSADEGNEAAHTEDGSGEAQENKEAVASEQRAVNLKESAFEKLYYVSSGYLMSYSNGKYVLVDHDMKAVEELPYDIPNGWTDFRGNQQDGRFICNVTLDDGTIQNEIFTPYLELVTGAKSGFGYITAYRDAIVFQDYKSEDGQTAIVMYCYDEFSNTKTSYIPIVGCDFLCESNMLWVARSKAINTDTNTMSYYYHRGSMADWLTENREPKKMVGGNIPGEKGKVVEFNDSAPSEDGWISAQLGTWSEKEENGKTLRYFDGESGFYNIFDNKFVKDPQINGKSSGSCEYFTDKNGCDKCTVINGRAVENFKNEDGTTQRYIFNVSTGECESDEAYSEVKLGFGKWIPVKTTDGKWGYLNSDTLEHEGLWYDYASEFCNGYAVVVADGKAHLVNDRLERASEDFDTSAGNIKRIEAVKDYLTYSDLNGQSVFFVYDDAGCHLLKVK